MTDNKLVLEVDAETIEGTHDFVTILEKVLEDIKGGHEKGDFQVASYDIQMTTANCDWKITTLP